MARWKQDCKAIDNQEDVIGANALCYTNPNPLLAVVDCRVICWPKRDSV